MSAVAATIAILADDIARLTSSLGQTVIVDRGRVADRRGDLDLKAPGIWSPNRSCRLVQTADGWIAVNLPRETDLWSIPAWIGCDIDADPWRAVVRQARHAATRPLMARARLLGLPVACVGEIVSPAPAAPLRRMASGVRRAGSRLTVLDLSSLWAGPLCGDILARMGAEVTKIESHGRPDAARAGSPAFYARLNDLKNHLALDFADPGDIAKLRAMMAAADVVITNARPRAFEQLGLSPAALFTINPGLTWVAITGYGWTGAGGGRVAFGDDAAAAGGLVRWSANNQPRFLGDALADPVTGLAAAVGALKAVARGGGLLVDAALARTAAGAAAAGRAAVASR